MPAWPCTLVCGVTLVRAMFTVWAGREALEANITLKVTNVRRSFFGVIEIVNWRELVGMDG